MFYDEDRYDIYWQFLKEEVLNYIREDEQEEEEYV